MHCFIGHCRDSQSIFEYQLQILMAISKFNINFYYFFLRTPGKQQMKIIEFLKNTVKMGDFFNSFQMLRYQQETDYRTFTGGLISLGIIITIVIAFANMIINTMNRTIIDFTQNYQRQTDPSLSVLTVSPENNFMFGVEVWGYNLSSEYRYFDVTFQQIQSHYGENYTYTPYPLEPCTRQHWSMLPDVIAEFDRLRVGNWLCPKIGTIIQIGGKYTSQSYHQYSLTLFPCNNETDPSRPCAPVEEMNRFIESNGQWNYFSYYFVNSIVNPDQPDFVHYYLEDRQCIVFGTQLGAELDMYLQEIEITSDNSIWPFSDYQYRTVYYIDFNPLFYPFAVTNVSCLATFYIVKDPTLQIYDRTVQKIFVVFSFMGGLIGAVMAGLFIINTYTSFAFEIALATDIFKDTQNSTTHKTLKHESKGSVNITHFLKYYLFQIAKKCKIDVEWPFIQYINECRDEILYQLDIKGLIKRIIFLQYSISYILEDYHLSEMQNQMSYHPADVRKLREKFQSAEISENPLSSQKQSDNAFCEPRSQVIFNTSNGLQTNDQLVSKRHQPIGPAHNDKVNVEFMDANSLPMFESRQEYFKKRTKNIKKLTQSARQGNAVSKKLLQVINSHMAEPDDTMKEIDLTNLEIKSTRKV